MAAVTENVSLPDIRLLAAAPHRFMFFVARSALTLDPGKISNFVHRSTELVE